jgi:hypothetical protein
MTEEKPKIKCEWCDKDATYWCKNCEYALCEYHSFLNSFHDNSVVPLSEAPIAKR